MQKRSFNWRRGVYIVLVYVLAPLVPLYLLWRARRQPEYAHGWLERFAWHYGAATRLTEPVRIWLHAVSVGETRAAEPLVTALLAQHSNAHVILTHTTPTGRAEGAALFARYLNEGRMTQVYVPYDLPDVLARFFKRFSPSALWLMETEVWPNMIAACAKRSIPIALINGRLSDKTLQKTLKNGFVAQLFGRAYGQLTHVCAQSQADAVRYQQVGVPFDRLVVTGNLKFDVSIPDHQVQNGLNLRRLAQSQTKQVRPLIVLLASTRDGEEQIWLEALARVDLPEIQWWIVPRHPQRFDDVHQLLSQSFVQPHAVVRKTELDQLSDESLRQSALAQAQVLLGDTMGEMFAYYAAADVVLMGGAWQPLGGQNFLEPLALGRPTLIGPHTFNFAQATHDAVQADALIQVMEMRDALMQLEVLVQHPEQLQKRQINAQQFVLRHQGAVQKTLATVL